MFTKENYSILNTIEHNYVKDVMEKEERIKKNVKIAKDKEWLLKCKWLVQECINNLRLLVKNAKDKESYKIKKMFVNNAMEKK